MKELFNALPRVSKADWLLDTCFVYYVFQHQKEKELIEFCKKHDVALTSFTVEELLYHMHDVNHIIRERLRYIIKHSVLLGVIELNVHPGEIDQEIAYVMGADEKLIHLIPDHSDAVVAAAAVNLGANIITRDKHHLFTTVLSDYFKELGLLVKNNF